MKTISLLGVTRTLRAPRSVTVCYEIWVTGPRNSTRALAAALGACLIEFDPKEPTISTRYSGDVMAYGAAVMDELVKKGAKPGEVTAAGLAAYQMLEEIASPAPSEEEVAAAEAPFAEAAATSPPST